MSLAVRDSVHRYFTILGAAKTIAPTICVREKSDYRRETEE